ncbi:aminoglycoside phosphotransferase family protein [Zhihengliuella flava]|uniref:Aminoglycoside phosphotransferase (APT) family kinase protein n=1 Tax=Zhihengliuella flava TaxID=1285193 RepID=A0A931GEA5_9MICC|nr:aminoglycoside phosphotransferase family protein [Zhihengliuella flava]MBG6083885.1 aminoglycoside phosphotransferase (APT) family kinase protein [Zhihengliuella flava]
MRPPTDSEIALAENLYPGPAWAQGSVAEGGQFHEVLVTEEAVLRMARDDVQAAQLPRRVALVDALSGRLPYAVPCSLSRIADGAVVQEFIPGAAHPPHTGDPVRLREVIAALAAVDVAPLRELLAPPFAYRGPWTESKIATTLTALGEHASDPASGAALVHDAALVLAELRQFADVPAQLVHGDLAGHNMHWIGGRVSGILDWDLAAAWDPALNVAYLAAWHGRDLVDELARDAEQARRARIWDGAMRLEGIYNASLRTDAPNWGKLMRKVAPRVHAAREAI